MLRIFTHRFCGDARMHDPSQGLPDGAEHQEGPARIQAIRSALESDAELRVVHVVDCAGEGAADAEERDRVRREGTRLASRVHDPEHVETLEHLCSGLGEGDAVPLTPRLLGRSEDVGSTRITSHSFTVAAAAAVTCVEATQWVLESPEPRAAFCLVRPPGHHAGLAKPDPQVGGCGFCLLNSVAIAASAAKESCERVAIVDFDVHHGNGTEECLKKLGRGFFYGSVHLAEVFPGDPDRDFFPGTGLVNCEKDDACIVVNCPVLPKWHAESSRKRKSSKIKRRKELVTGREGFLEAMQNVLVPALAKFAPDILFISAGFDAALNDEGNLDETGEISGSDLSASDFFAMTQMLSKSCKKIVSVLEGGYGTYNPARGTYDRSSLAQCCVEHIRALSMLK